MSEPMEKQTGIRDYVGVGGNDDDVRSLTGSRNVAIPAHAQVTNAQNDPLNDPRARKFHAVYRKLGSAEIMVT